MGVREEEWGRGGAKGESKGVMDEWEMGWWQYPLRQRQEEEQRTSETMSSILNMLSLRPGKYPSKSFLQRKKVEGYPLGQFHH